MEHFVKLATRYEDNPNPCHYISAATSYLAGTAYRDFSIEGSTTNIHPFPVVRRICKGHSHTIRNCGGPSGNVS